MAPKKSSSKKRRNGPGRQGRGADARGAEILFRAMRPNARLARLQAAQTALKQERYARAVDLLHLDLDDMTATRLGPGSVVVPESRALARALRGLGRLEEAVSVLQSTLATEGGEGTALLRFELGLCLAALERADEARPALLSALRQDWELRNELATPPSDRLRTDARARAERRRTEDERLFCAGIGLKGAPALAALGREVANDERDALFARWAVRQAALLNSASPEVLVSLADVLSRYDPDAALAGYRQVASLASPSVDVERALAWHEQALARWEQDAAQARAAVASGSAEAWYALGRLYVRRLRWHDAASAFEEAVRVRGSGEDLLAKAVSLAETGREEPAIETFLEASRAGAAAYALWETWPSCPAAQRALRRAGERRVPKLEKGPATAKARLAYAVKVEEEGLLAEAATAYRDALRLAPGSAAAQVGLGRVLEELGDAEGALAAYAEGERRAPKDVQIGCLRAHLLHRLGRWDEAVLLLDRVLRLQPKDAGHWASLGTALNRLGRHEEALNAFDRTEKLDRAHFALHPEDRLFREASAAGRPYEN